MAVRVRDIKRRAMDVADVILTLFLILIAVGVVICFILISKLDYYPLIYNKHTHTHNVPRSLCIRLGYRVETAVIKIRILTSSVY